MKKIFAALTLAAATSLQAAPYAPQEFDFTELLGTVERVTSVTTENRFGNAFEHVLEPQRVDQLTVRLDDGRAVVVPQEEMQRFVLGQRVRLVGSSTSVRIEHE